MKSPQETTTSTQGLMDMMLSLPSPKKNKTSKNVIRRLAKGRPILYTSSETSLKELEKSNKDNKPYLRPPKDTEIVLKIWPKTLSSILNPGDSGLLPLDSFQKWKYQKGYHNHKSYPNRCTDEPLFLEGSPIPFVEQLPDWKVKRCHRCLQPTLKPQMKSQAVQVSHGTWYDTTQRTNRHWFKEITPNNDGILKYLTRFGQDKCLTTSITSGIPCTYPTPSTRITSVTSANSSDTSNIIAHDTAVRLVALIVEEGRKIAQAQKVTEETTKEIINVDSPDEFPSPLNIVSSPEPWKTWNDENKKTYSDKQTSSPNEKDCEKLETSKMETLPPTEGIVPPMSIFPAPLDTNAFLRDLQLLNTYEEIDALAGGIFPPFPNEMFETTMTPMITSTMTMTRSTSPKDSTRPEDDPNLSDTTGPSFPFHDYDFGSFSFPEDF
jgi:hypothetical protein